MGLTVNLSRQTFREKERVPRVAARDSLGRGSEGSWYTWPVDSRSVTASRRRPPKQTLELATRKQAARPVSAAKHRLQQVGSPASLPPGRPQPAAPKGPQQPPDSVHRALRARSFAERARRAFAEEALPPQLARSQASMWTRVVIDSWTDVMEGA